MIISELSRILEEINISSDVLASLLRLIESPTEVTHLQDLCAELKQVLPIVVELDPVNVDKIKPFIAIIDKLTLEKNASLLSSFPSASSGSAISGVLQGNNTKYPIYGSLIQFNQVTDLNLHIAKALLFILLYSSPDRFDIRGKGENSCRSLADAIRKAATNNVEWKRLFSNFPAVELVQNSEDKFTYLLGLVDENKLPRSINGAWTANELRPLRICTAIIETLKESWDSLATDQKTAIRLGDSSKREPSHSHQGAYSKGSEKGRLRYIVDQQETLVWGEATNDIVSDTFQVKRFKSKIWDKEFDSDGLSEVELVDDTIVVDFRPTYLLPLVNSVISTAFIAHAKYVTEMDNQHLSWSWPALNQHDISILNGEITALINSNIRSQVEIGICIGLMLVTGRDVSDIYRIIICLHYPILEPSRLAKSPPIISISEKSWLNVQTVPEARYLPKGEEEFQLQRVGDLLRLPLSNLIVEGLSKILTEDKAQFEGLMSVDENEMWSQIRKILKQIRRKHGGARITSSRIRDSLSRFLIKETADPVFGAAILGGSRVPLGGAPYYVTFQAEKLRETYIRTISEMDILGGLTQVPTQYVFDHMVGSRLRPRNNVVPSLVQGLIDKIAKESPLRAGSQSLISFHNAFVNYTLSMLMFATGHRAVRDPFESFEYILENINIAVICDKAHLQGNEGRVVILSDLAVAQLLAYKNHLSSLAMKMAKYDQSLSAQIEATAEGGVDGLWLFFELDEGLNTSPFGKKTLEQKWREHGFMLPINSTRHILSTELQALNVPPEYISAHLGHSLEGQQIFGRSSIVNPAGYVETVGDALDTILRKQGWHFIEGIKRYKQSRYDVSGTEERVQVIRGHVIRAANREKRAYSKYRRILDTLISEFSPQGTWTVGAVKLLIKKVNRLEEPAHVIGRVSQLISRYLKRHAPLIMAKIDWKPGVVMLRDSSPIKLLHANKYRELGQLEDRLNNRIEMEPEPSSEELLARIVVIATVQGIASASRLRQLISALIEKKIYIMDGCIWLECGEEPMRRRWFPQGLAVLLCFAWLRRDENKISHDDVLASLSKNWLVKSNNKKVLRELSELGDAALRIKIPGYLSAYAREESPATSLSLEAWLRVWTGKAVYVKNIKNNISIPNARSPLFRGDIDIEGAYALWAKVRSRLIELDKGKASRADVINDLKVDSYGSISPVAQALNEWIISELSRQKKLASSSIRNYGLNIGSFLLVAAVEMDDFLELDPEEYTDLYIKVSSMGKESNRLARVRLIVRFHRFMEEYYGTRGFIESELGTGDRYGVSANIITESEYQKSLEWIGKQDSLMLSIRREAYIALMLLFYLGLRVKELERLRPQDIFVTEPGIVAIRSFARQRTKSASGQRQINIESRIPKTDVEKLSGYLEDVVNQPIKAHRLLPNFSINSSNEENVAKLILRAIRAVAGDERLTLRNLRHSAATWALVNPTQNRKMVPAHWQMNIDENIAHDSNFGHTLPIRTRRSLYQLALQQGHAHPTTTVRHYCHLLDWQLAQCFQVSGFAPLSSSTVAKLVGLTATNYRKIGSRFPIQSDLMYQLLKRQKMSITTAAEIDILLSNNSDSDINTAHDKLIPRCDLNAIINVLDRYSIGEKPERISAITTYPIGFVQRWIYKAVDLEKTTGFDQFRLTDEAFREKLKKPRNIALRNEILKMENLVSNNEPCILKYLSFWQDFYRPDIMPLYLPSIEACASVIDALEMIGIGRDKIEIKIPSNHPYSNSGFTQELFKEECGIDRIQIMSNRSITVHVGQQKRVPGLGVSFVHTNEKSAKESGTMNAIHYASFLCLVSENKIKH